MINPDLYPPRPDWMDSAPCATADPEVWFPAAKDAVTARLAKKICNTRCAHRLACLRYAIETKASAGIWGGKTEKERRKITLADLDRLGEAA